jgi:hypothetical protein
MIRLLIRAGIFLASAAVGLLAAAVILDDFTVTASGFVITVVVYALVQSVISPFVFKVAAANANALLGGVGIVSTLIALLVASLISDALTVSGGLGTWVLAALIVWVFTAAATILLPVAMVRAGVESARQRRS